MNSPAAFLKHKQLLLHSQDGKPSAKSMHSLKA